MPKPGPRTTYKYSDEFKATAVRLSEQASVVVHVDAIPRMKMLSNMKIPIPWWLTLIIILETLPMFIGPYLALTNPAFVGGPGVEELNRAAFMYSARNLAVGFAFIIAFALRNGPMLFILIFVRLFTDLIDLPTLFAFSTNLNLVVVSALFVFLYYIPALIALRYLWIQMIKDGGQRATA
jgi:hypothetical protein